MHNKKKGFAGCVGMKSSAGIKNMTQQKVICAVERIFVIIEDDNLIAHGVKDHRLRHKGIQANAKIA